MPCYNNGQYVNAAPSYDDDSESLMNLGHAPPRNESLEHCICHNGFTGLNCEAKYYEYGNGEHMCLHGSKCILKDDLWTCECEEAFCEDHKYAGEICQRHHTTICTTTDTSNNTTK